MLSRVAQSSRNECFQLALSAFESVLGKKFASTVQMLWRDKELTDFFYESADQLKCGNPVEVIIIVIVPYFFACT